MRLAFEAAIRSAKPDTLVRWTPLILKTKADGVLSAPAWSGPRDRA